jgi:hypothetical protein
MGNYIILIMIHALADLVFQGDRLSYLKQKKSLYLIIHVSIYTVFLLITSMYLLKMATQPALIFVAINAAAHLAIDFSTGKLKRLFWKGQREGSYFVTSAIDQLLHVTILLATYYFFTTNY